MIDASYCQFEEARAKYASEREQYRQHIAAAVAKTSDPATAQVCDIAARIFLDERGRGHCTPVIYVGQCAKNRGFTAAAAFRRRCPNGSGAYSGAASKQVSAARVTTPCPERRPGVLLELGR